MFNIYIYIYKYKQQQQNTQIFDRLLPFASLSSAFVAPRLGGLLGAHTLSGNEA